MQVSCFLMKGLIDYRMMIMANGLEDGSVSQHRAPLLSSLLSSNGTAISANAFQTYCWHIGWKVHIFSSSLSLAPLTAVLHTTPFKHI